MRLLPALLLIMLLPAAAADAGADGVIVGSRLVREADEASDPVRAVGEVVAAMSEALR